VKNHKIVPLDELAQIVSQLKAEGKKVVHCHGVFDLLHPGHILHFQAARGLGDILVVTITRDAYVDKGPGRPVFKERLRAESLAALEVIDYVAFNDWPTSVETIRRLRPDIYAKGSDYRHPEDDVTGKIKEEEQAILSVGGKAHFTDELTFSSTSLLNAHFSVYPEAAEKFLRDFRQRYSAEETIKWFQKLLPLKVLVLGDTIIDEYHYCAPMAKSPKENLIPAKYISEETFAGGILASANHVAGFCADVHLLTCLGIQNNYEKFILQHLRPNIKGKFFYREDAPTVVKRRFVDPAFLSKMFEVCFMNSHELPPAVAKQIADYLNACVSQYDLVVVNDFGHGFMTPEIIDVVCEKSRFLAVNAQTNSANMGFNLVTKYPRADYICLDEAEARLACHDRTGDLREINTRLAKSSGCSKVAVTQGHQGSLVYDREGGLFEIPVFSLEVKDRVGAGDAYFSITSPCVAAGFPAELVGFIGNAVGALAVRIVGNRTPVEPVPLFKFIKALLTA